MKTLLMAFYFASCVLLLAADKGVVTTTPNATPNGLAKPSSASDIVKVTPDEFVTITDVLGRSIRVFVLDEDEHSMTGLKNNGQKFTIGMEKLTQESKDVVKKTFAAHKNEFERLLDLYLSLQRSNQKTDFQGFKMGMSQKETAACFLENYKTPLTPSEYSVKDGEFYDLDYQFNNKGRDPTQWKMRFKFRNDQLVAFFKEYDEDIEGILLALKQEFLITSNSQVFKSNGQVEFLLMSTSETIGMLSSYPHVIYDGSQSQTVGIGLIDRSYFRQYAIKHFEKSYIALRAIATFEETCLQSNTPLKTTDISGKPDFLFPDFQVEYDGFLQMPLTYDDPKTDYPKTSEYNGYICCYMNQFISFFMQFIYVPRDGVVTVDSNNFPRYGVGTVDYQNSNFYWNLNFSWQTNDGCHLEIRKDGKILIAKRKELDPVHL